MIFKYGLLHSKLGLNDDIVEQAKYFCIFFLQI